MRSLLLLLPLLVLGPFAFADSPDWNQWRGPTRDGKVPADAWPSALTDQVKLVWERPHSPSYSGPIVCGKLVFTTETINKSVERVTAYDLESGERAWQVEWPGAMSVPFFAASNGDWIRSTPACTPEHLVVLGMRDVLVCLDPQTGNEQWRVDFPEQMKTQLPAFGAVCSPIIDDDFVYVQTGGALVKLSLADGKIVWKTLENAEGMMSGGAFSSPVIATLAGLRQLVVQTREELCGVELETGKVLWKQSIQAFRGMNILTPLIVPGDRIFTSAHSGKAQLFQIESSATDQWLVTELWSQSSQAYMSSPLLVGDSIFMHMKNQRVASLGLSDGAANWVSTPQGKYWSMAQSGDKILALDNDGDLLLIQASNSALEIVDSIHVAENSWAHLAVQGEYLIVRDLGALKVFRWK